MSKEINEDDILQKITDTPNLLSALYDADLLPEQTAHEPDLYRRTLVIAALWPNRRVPDPKIAALEAQLRELQEAVQSALDWRGLDGKGITDPLALQLACLLTAT